MTSTGENDPADAGDERIAAMLRRPPECLDLKMELRTALDLEYVGRCRELLGRPDSLPQRSLA